MSRALSLLAFLLLAVTSSATFALGQDEATVASEPQVKAALIYNFAKYVRWPEESLRREDLFAIGVLGTETAIVSQLEQISSRKTIGGRKILVKTFSTLSDLEPVHILYVGASFSGRVSAIKDALAGQNVLSVGESESFIQDGGIIQFVSGSEQVRFMVNDREARGVGLKINQELLELADKVF